MTSAKITSFDPAPELQAVIAECMQNYDVGDRDAEWPNNIISRRAIVYSSGVITRGTAPIAYAVDLRELSLCRQLAAEAAGVMGETSVGMGSESGDPFRGFFIACNVNEPLPTNIDEALIRHRFGGTIFPPATITIEPLVENGIWWAEVLQDGADSEPAYFAPWRAMIEWFRARGEFVTTAFVRIGDRRALEKLPRAKWPAGTELPGCALPRLALGLTLGGSLVGLFGHSVQT